MTFTIDSDLNSTHVQEPGQADEEPKPARKKRSGKTAAKRGEKTRPERSGKKAKVLSLMKRAKGATLTELMEATGWQKHSVRGVISVLGSKGGQTIESSKNASGERTYKIVK